MDIISRLPENIIEMILTLMPIRDAVRTSILSTKWRYNWVKIPKLVFDFQQFRALRVDPIDDRLKFFSDPINQVVLGHQIDDALKLFSDAINQVVLLYQGPIVEFHLKRIINRDSDFDTINQIIPHLSRNNTLKIFTLKVNDYKLPSSLFNSLRQLTHLDLSYCELESPSTTFNGFNMLTSLSLKYVEITEKVLLHLISGCPRLKHFTFIEPCYGFGFQAEDNFIVQLFKCLKVIEYLGLNVFSIQWCFIGRDFQKLPISLLHLKQLDLFNVPLMRQCDYSFTLLLIRSSPNLEKIKIEVRISCMEDMTVFLVLRDCANVRLDYLTEFEIDNYRHSIAESELLKLILVKSHMLKKVHLKKFRGDENKTNMLKSFILNVPRASPNVDIILHHDNEDYEWYLQYPVRL